MKQATNPPEMTVNKLPPAMQSTFQSQPHHIPTSTTNDQPGELCPLCIELYKPKEMMCFGSCGHYFCQDCLAKYCVYKIGIMVEPSCPQEECQCRFGVESSIYDLLPEESKQKYRRLLLWKQTIANPNLRLCPTEDCQGFINTASGAHQCPTCLVTFCRECQLPEHEGPCDSNFQLQFNMMKRCPACKMFIQKIDGCNHVTCRCGHQFCYYCLENWRDSHYQCGQDDSQNESFFLLADVANWKRVLLGLVLLLLLPFITGFLLIFMALAIMVGLVMGLYMGPVTLILHFSFLQNPFCLVLLPFLVVTGAFLGLWTGFSFSFSMELRLLKFYMLSVCDLLTWLPEVNQEDIVSSFGQEQLQEELQ